MLVSINFKLFRKLTSRVWKTRFHCSNLSIKDSISIKIYMEKTRVPQKKKTQVSSSKLFPFSKQPILLVSFSSQKNQRKTKEIKALPLLKTTKEKRKKTKAKTEKPSKKSKETQQAKTKKPNKQRQRNPATHGRSGEEDQLCSSTSVRFFFFTLFLCCCLHLHHE